MTNCYYDSNFLIHKQIHTIEDIALTRKNCDL